MKIPDFNLCENKDADQLLSFAVTVKLISAFVFAKKIGFIKFSFTSLSRLFQLISDGPISRWGENGRTPKKHT